MTEHTAKHWEQHLEARIPELVERVVKRATQYAERASRDTEHLELRIQRAAEKARRQANRAEARAARLNEKVQRKVENGKPSRMKDELRSLALEIEREALKAVESALREIDVESVIKRVEEELSNVDVDGISRQAQDVLNEASAQVQVALERRGFVPKEGNATPTPEPVSDEERLAVLRMVQNGNISAEEAELLLNSLEGSAS